MECLILRKVASGQKDVDPGLILSNLLLSFEDEKVDVNSLELRSLNLGGAGNVEELKSFLKGKQGTWILGAEECLSLYGKKSNFSLN